MAYTAPPSWDDLPLVLTADETACVLRVHVSTVKQLCRAGKLRGVKVGRAWRIMRSDLLLLLEGDCAGSAAEQETPHNSARL